jgi:hypothetical protein
VTDLLRRFRGLAIAVVVLAMSAGMVFAAAPHVLPADNTATAGADDPADGADEDANETPDAEDPGDDDQGDEAGIGAPETEAPETPEANAPETADANTAPTDTHGALVSAAAQMVTPAGFRNHGAFVSCVAHMKDATLATIDWTTVTPESCAAAGHGKSADAKANADAKKAEHAAAKAAREAARAAAGHGHP